MTDTQHAWSDDLICTYIDICKFTVSHESRIVDAVTVSAAEALAQEVRKDLESQLAAANQTAEEWKKEAQKWQSKSSDLQSRYSELEAELVTESYTWQLQRMVGSQNTQIVALQKRIDELEEMLEAARTQRITSSAPCPLCRWEEGGIFVEACGLHKDIETLIAQGL